MLCLPRKYHFVQESASPALQPSMLKPDLGEGIHGQKAPRTLLAPLFLGFYLSARPRQNARRAGEWPDGRAGVPYAQAGPKTIMR